MWFYNHISIVTLALCVFNTAIDYSLAFDESQVNLMLETSFKCHRNPAMAVAVVKNGQTLYSNGFGVTNIDTKKPVTDETLFGIASITKSFANALFVKLLYQNTNLTIDSKVHELLKDFVMPDEVRTKETTFLDMLSHKTAMLSNNRIRFDTNFNRDTVLSRLRSLPSTKQFRVDYIYNNLIYGAIGRITELLGGDGKTKRWEDLVSEHLFKPLGMTKSTFATRIDFNRDDLAQPYRELDAEGIQDPVPHEVSRRWADLCASGSIISSVKQMTNWMKFHLSGGKNVNGDQVLDQKLVDELHTPRFSLRSKKYLGIEKPQFPITAMETAYALGLRIGHYRGNRLIAHTGGTYGYNTYMVMLPDEDIGVIVLQSGNDGYFRQRTAVSHYLLDSALGIEPYLNASTVCSFPHPWLTNNLTYSYRPKRTDVLLDFQRQEYEGMYSNEAFGTLSIHYNSTQDSLQMKYGWGDWDVFVWPKSENSTTNDQEQRFYGKGIGPIFAPDMKPLYFIAHPEKAGTIVGFTGTAFDKNLPPIFCKKEYIKVCEKIAEQKNYPTRKTAKPNCPSGSDSLRHANGTFGILMSLAIFIHLLNAKLC